MTSVVVPPASAPPATSGTSQDGLPEWWASPPFNRDLSWLEFNRRVLAQAEGASAGGLPAAPAALGVDDRCEQCRADVGLDCGGLQRVGVALDEAQAELVDDVSETREDGRRGRVTRQDEHEQHDAHGGARAA